jgi:hypothetical protein
MYHYYAPYLVRGGASFFAKASEDMPQGARNGRVGENFEKRNAEGGNFSGGNLGREGGVQFF